MGEHVGWAEPNGLLPNGVLPNEGKVFCVLDSERWLKAEERTADLIACIQPNEPSEERRNAVADYVQRLIMKCFPCQVFTFGSVPLKTYLPDGDIDLTAFSNNQTLKDTWANLVSDMLKNEEKNDQAEFRVKEVQYIQAEVKIIKCLVENIVVDISFNQLGGLCTLCFLEEVDHLINHNHLFKRSIILIKAWCYYESRILGAHHGLISTYALETLVLYIFHVFNNSFTGPLEVLYRFLEFFSKFDWDNFCVSLWGPVPVSSLPDVTAEPPRKDGGNLLLSKLFLDACSTVYAVFPSSPENQSQPILSKYFNVIDPLRVNNNLGRSVSKGNFYRIRSAFALGAKRLARLLDCPKENLIFEVNNFFKTTWERHGSGRRPDALETDNITKPDDFKSNKKGRKTNNAAREKTCNHVGNVDEGQRSTKSDHLVNGINGRSMFARTNSSPDELSDMSTQVRRRRVLNSNNRKENGVPDGLNNHTGQSLIVDLSSVRMAPSHQGVAASVCGYHHHHDSGGCSDALIEEELGLNEEEQDLVNMMESSSLNHFNNGHVPSSYDLRSTHLPIIMPPSFLASLGYTQRNLVPDPCMQFTHGFFPQQPLAHRFPGGLGLSSNLEYSREQSNCENIGLVEAENDLWQEQEVTENCSLEMLQPGGSEPNKQVFMAKENSSGLVPLYLTIPPLPFLTMLPPVCETGCSDTAPEMLEDKDTWTEGGSFEHCNGIITTSTISCDEYNKCDDILNSDFGSHFQNMQFGRFCQNPPNPGPMMFYPNPVMIQPDGPGRPLLPTNFNLLTQLMATPRVVPVAPPPSLPNRPPPPPNIYQRSGTGTYLPKAVSVRDYRPSSNPKRVNYHYDRNDSHGGDGEGNWKTRAGGGRIHNRNQAEKSISRLGRLSSAAATTTSESQADRSWGGSYRNVSISSFSRANMGGPPIPPGVAYGGATTTTSSTTSTTSVPSVVMFYPFDHGEHLEFGSLGPIGGGGGAFDEQHRSPDQPSSPRHPHRRF